VADAAFRLTFALKVTHPLEKRRLQQISAYNVSTVRDGEKSAIMTNIKSTTGFPMAYGWNAYVTLSPPKGGSIAIFLFFNKIQFQSNKACCEVSLSEKLQRRGYSITITPPNGSYILARNKTLQPKIQPQSDPFPLKSTHASRDLSAIAELQLST